MITFTRSVGTAPGTTVLVENDGLSTLGVMQCPPEPMPIHLVQNQQTHPADARLFPPQRWNRPEPTPWGPRATVPALARRRPLVLNPYPTIADLKSTSGLGIVLTQGGGWEINRTLPGGPPYLGPYDPQYYRRGETGYYYDTPLGGLGAIPTDAELGPNQCYTPVQSAWIYSEEGYIAPPYVPPNEWRPVANRYGPPTAPLGAAENTGDIMIASAAVRELSKHQMRMFYLSALSTAAIVAVASINIVRAMRQKRRAAEQ